MVKRVVAIGVFDGVHRGHQEILNRAKEIADGGSVIALTFDPHPATVFAPERAPKLLVTLADRVVLLKIHNSDQVAVIKFDEKFVSTIYLLASGLIAIGWSFDTNTNLRNQLDQETGLLNK